MVLRSWVEGAARGTMHLDPEWTRSGRSEVQIRVIGAPALQQRHILSVISPFLESTLLGACPGLRESWESHRRTFVRGEEADDGALLEAVRRYVVGLLASGRVAEFSRFARMLERLLGEADPMLYELLREGLLRPLAHEVRDAGIEHSRFAPYLGARTALAWPRDP